MMPPGFQPGQLQQRAPFWQPPVQPRPKPPAPKAVPKPPVARGQTPDEPKPAVKPALPTLPSPEQLGVAVPLSWLDIRVRLDRVGATAFTLEKESAGYRFACKLPSGRTVEARAATESEAARQALAQAEGK